MATVLFGKRQLLIGLAVCAFLQVASLRTRRIVPALPDIPIATVGLFEPDGEYPGEAFTNASSVRKWGSWSGSDDNAGTITLGPFPAPRRLRLGIGGYPGHEGNALRLELADQSRSMPLKPADVGERWNIQDFELPAGWEGRPMRIVGTDTAIGVGGWFSITEPVRGGRSEGNNALIRSLAAFAINGLLLGVIYWAAVQLLSRFNWSRGAPAGDEHNAAGAPHPHHAEMPWLAPHWIPLGAGAIVALCGYAAFWAYFVNAIVGVIFSWTVIAAAACTILCDGWPRDRGHPVPSDRMQAGRPRSREITTVLILMLTIGAFHISLLHLFPTSHDFYTLAANRHREAMPSDNELPHTTAQRLFASESLKNPIDEWLSSDRPPLQAGWQLLTWPATKVLGHDRRTASGTSAVWFQLLWIAAACGLLRSFAVERVRAAGWIAALALCGFFVQNTTYTWPKLAAGAFACGAVGVLLFPTAGSGLRRNAMSAAGFAGLAWLAHGGVAFSFLAFLPLLAWRVWRTGWRRWAPAALALAVLVSPWLAYQTFYDPPANRLFKWHLAGQSGKDARGTWETLREQYAKIGWREAWKNKVSNLHAQVFGDWKHLVDVSAATAGDRRHQEFFHTGRALTWWPLLAVFAVVLTRRRVFVAPRDFVMFASWLLLTIVIWCLLMFGQYQAVIHHGSYAPMLGLFVLFSVILERSGRGWLGVIALLQAVTLGTTWAIGNGTINGSATGVSFVIASAAGLAWFVVRAFIPFAGWSCGAPAAVPERNTVGTPNAAGAPRLQDTAARAPTAESPPDIWPRAGDSLCAWWADPRLNFRVLAALALVLFLRKPHALHTPQLWAEDGSIFLMQADLHGLSALLMPYMGYLHTLPRIIAAIAPPLLDPAWWPAFYNGISFAIWLAVLARLFTSRLDLPGKPWLAFALIAVPHTGEVFFNITNLQWLTAFVLIQQVLIHPPTTSGRRVSDMVILALVTLTGPFGIIFLPLFAGRWWRERNGASAAAFLVVLLCAALQAWFVIQTGPRFEYQSEPFRLWTILVVLARRLVVYPLFGHDVALGMSPALIAAIGGTLMAALMAWALRPHPWRHIRSQVMAAFLLITLAAVYRTRPDTWAADNLDYGDRYFYIPRVLLAWLLIWEFNAVPRAVANAARVFCVAVLCVHVRSYTVRAPIDYHWARHVEPIRKGVPADLPTLPEGWMMEYRGRPGLKP